MSSTISRVIVDGVSQAFEGEHIAHLADHRAAVHPQGIVALGRVLLLERSDIQLAPRVAGLEALGFHLMPVLGRAHRGADVMRDGIVPVFGDFSQQSVLIQDDFGRLAHFHHHFVKPGIEPGVAADDFDPVKVEENGWLRLRW